MPVRTVNNNADIKNLQQSVREASAQTRAALDELPADPMAALHTLRFNQYGRHPLEDRPLNLIEQFNQTSTIMASLAAARHLLDWFPDCGGLRLHLGTSSGRDIESIRPDVVEAEVFAAVDPNNADKMNKDIGRLAESNAKHRYVFFYSPLYEANAGRQPGLELPDSRVRVWALGLEEVM